MSANDTIQTRDSFTVDLVSEVPAKTKRSQFAQIKTVYNLYADRISEVNEIVPGKMIHFGCFFSGRYSADGTKVVWQVHVWFSVDSSESLRDRIAAEVHSRFKGEVRFTN